MNLLNKCSKKDVELMKQAGVVLEDKDYNSEQLEKCEQELKVTDNLKMNVPNDYFDMVVARHTCIP